MNLTVEVVRDLLHHLVGGCGFLVAEDRSFQILDWTLDFFLCTERLCEFNDSGYVARVDSY